MGGDHQYRVSGVYLYSTRHIALGKMKQWEVPVQFPRLGFEFVASAHRGISCDAIYSSLYSILRVYKDDFRVAMWLRAGAVIRLGIGIAQGRVACLPVKPSSGAKV
jgi:hypothetical protein